MIQHKRLKIAYLCDLSPFESWTYSGGNARIYASLQKHVGDVTVLGNQWHGLELLRRLMHRLPVAWNIRLRWRLHLLFSGLIGRDVARRIDSADFDVLFCPYAFYALAGVKTDRPVIQVFSSDATPSTYKRSSIGESFGSFFSISRLLDPLILRAETKVLNANDLNLWPSEWQKKAADDLYELDPENSIVLPWGANIETPEGPLSGLDISSKQPIKLLFVGRDWFAKGGPITFETVLELRRRGLNVSLDVVGVAPPEEFQGDFITLHGSLDKNNPEQRRIFEGLYRNSHFLVMPSFEAYGFAFCEASAYGLPSLCLDVGGIPVKKSVNGHALEHPSKADDFADVIETYAKDPVAYQKLRGTSHAYFTSTLNWDAWGQSVALLLKQKLAQKQFGPPAP